jgi:hypothetical protein
VQAQNSDLPDKKNPAQPELHSSFCYAPNYATLTASDR